jgi:hypothetical protein
LGKLHDSLKNWLISFGQSNGYEAWTTDLRNNVEFSKIRNIKIDYRPDVVWQSKRTKDKVFFELAFTEDFRQVIGEILLGSLVYGYAKTFIIKPSGDEDYWKNIEKFMRFAFKKNGIFRKYDAFSPRFIIFKRSLEKRGEEGKIKEVIVEELRRDKWIK